ncbi:MAG: glycerate kinase [Clostridiales bacterium]|nr:glycerate kinase [Clostridiales bacterium]
MKLLIAIDSYKGSLSSADAGAAAREGVLRGCPGAEVIALPIADGGEGTADAIAHAKGGQLAECRAHDPLGREIISSYGIAGDTAIIEMAKASGLELLKKEEYNPLITSTRGTGELILSAIDAGCREFILGIGGSATNDGGMGMAKALGAKFLDDEGNELGEGGAELLRLDKIDISSMDGRLCDCRFRVACDVTNPLYGENGASRVFGPQKGASAEDVELLDKALHRYGNILERDVCPSIASRLGAGAAGGLGAAFMAFLKGTPEKGAELVLEAVGIDALLHGCDAVITGEGRTDFQTVFGKAPIEVARHASNHNIPCYIISGSLGRGYEKVLSHGVTACFSITDGPMELKEAMENAPRLLSSAAEMLARVIAK